MHLIKTFSIQLCKYLIKSNCNCSKLVKFHDTGDFDFSFPLSLKIWKIHLKDVEINEENYQDNILNYAGENENSEQDSSDCIAKLKENSKNFDLVIDEVEIKNFRCFLTVKRNDVFKKFLTKITSNYGKRKKIEDETLSLEIDDESEENSTSITQHRVNLVGKVVKNLLEYSKFILVNDPSIAKHKILVTSKSNLSKNDGRTNRKLITSGSVLDNNDKKVSKLTAQDHIKKRSEEMHLISIHKYGIRVKDNENFLEFVRKLGEDVVNLELLEVKHSSPLILISDPKQAFVLYNSARMETLLTKFETKVAEGYYQELPGIEDIDTGLLKEDEEWNLMKLLLSFPEVIDLAIDDLPNGRISLHLIHKFISSLAQSFSVYYRRVRLLTENRNQLMPVLHAKVHFLKIVRMILNEALAIFDIQPVALM